MKYIKIRLLLWTVFALFPMVLSAQNTLNINGVVLKSNGDPILGAFVTSNTVKKGVATNTAGEFTIEVAPNATLTVEAIGYKTRTLVANADIQEILLEEDELINVALRTVSKQDLASDVSYINIPEILEKNFHTYSLDNLQSYIPGYNGGTWGYGTALVVVDGVPRDASNVLPTEIEQISVLKGVNAVALYGSKAAKGAIIITTKRGTDRMNQINVRANTGIGVPKAYPKYLGSAEYLALYNEAGSNDSGVLYDSSISDPTIENYASGTNPYRFPDVDYYSSDYLRKVSNSSNVTAEFVGGKERARFYANIGLSHNNSLLNVGEGKNDATTRLNMRGNLDIKLNEFISSKVNATMVFYDSKGAQGNYWKEASEVLPNRYSPLLPIDRMKGRTPEEQAALDAFVDNSSFVIDGQYLLGGNSNKQTNAFADMYTKGSNTYSSRNFQFDATVDFDLRSVLKGLSFSTQFGIDYLSSFNLSVNNNTYAVYNANWWTDDEGNEYIYELKKENNDKASRGRDLRDSYLRQNIFFTAGFNYKNTFGDGHNVSGLLNARGNQESISQIYHKTSSANLGFQAAYNYRHKYYVDFTGNVVHSAKYASGARQAFSPTVSAAWRISEEGFLADSDIVNDLRISASAGVVHTDLDFEDYYMYAEVYKREGWSSWQEGRGRASTYITCGENLDLTFAKRKEINVGVDATLFNHMLRVSASYFRSEMTGLPIESANFLPSYFRYSTTNMLTNINYNADLRTGFDFGVNFNKRVGKVDLLLGVNGTYYDTEALKRNEINLLYDNQKRQGRPSDGIYGMVSNGFYQNEAEIAAHNVERPLGAVKPGDIRYEDITGDGIIDDKDIKYLGRWSSPFVFGMNVTLKWKDFTFFALANGSFGGHALKNNAYHWVYDQRKYSEVVRGRCILGADENGALYVTNPESATYPRLTAQNTGNNFRDSDFWLYKTDRFNLSKVQITYDFPQHLFNNKLVSGLGIYVSGSDLLVIAKERKIMEMNVGSSPQNRFYNLGLKVSF